MFPIRCGKLHLKQFRLEDTASAVLITHIIAAMPVPYECFVSGDKIF